MKFRQPFIVFNFLFQTWTTNYASDVSLASGEYDEDDTSDNCEETPQRDRRHEAKQACPIHSVITQVLAAFMHLPHPSFTPQNFVFGSDFTVHVFNGLFSKDEQDEGADLGSMFRNANPTVKWTEETSTSIHDTASQTGDNRPSNVSSSSSQNPIGQEVSCAH